MSVANKEKERKNREKFNYKNLFKKNNLLNASYGQNLNMRV
jgi:hypothetical protein